MSNYLHGVIPANSDVDFSGYGNYYGISPEATTVLFKPGDTFGLIAAFASLLPIALCVALLTVFLCRRTAEDLWIGAGQVFGEVLNTVLKLIIKEKRPHTPVINMPEDSYGMPSAHSQYMGYFATVMTMQTLFAKNISMAHRLFRIASLMGISVLTAYSRYYLYYHTLAQVICGFLFGMFYGLCWYSLGGFLRITGLMSWGISLWPFRLMLVKDQDYSVSTEYEEYQRELQKKKR